MTTALCDLPAVVLRDGIRAGKIKSVDLVESCIKRIEEINPFVNAFVTLDYASARTAASAADAYVASHPDGPFPPLLGLPVGVKDLDETAGMRTTYGCLVFKDNVPKEDSVMVARVRKAGGIIIGKTNTPEFGAGANTRNRVFGASGNPFDPSLTSAGSSGGSAVALACGMVPLATGSDMGGSLRTPASFCSVVGFRPSPGIIGDDRREMAFSGLAVLGPMARSVTDLILLMSVQAGYCPGDPLSPPIPETLDPLTSYNLLPSVSLPKLKAVWSDDLGFAPVSSSIKKVFHEKVSTLLAPLFAPSSRPAAPGELSMLANTDRIFSVLRGEKFATSFESTYKKWWDQLGYAVRENALEGKDYTYKDRGEAHQGHSKLVREFEKWWTREDVDLMIVPAAAVSPFPHTTWAPTSIDGLPMRNYFTWLSLAYGITITSHPSIVIPVGVDHLGLPIGVQLVGPRWGDRFILAVAREVEKMLGEKGEGRRLPDFEKLKTQGGKVGIEVYVP